MSVGGSLYYAFYFYECFKFFIVKRKQMKQTKKDFSRKQKLRVKEAAEVASRHTQPDVHHAVTATHAPLCLPHPPHHAHVMSAACSVLSDPVRPRGL